MQRILMQYTKVVTMKMMKRMTMKKMRMMKKRFYTAHGVQEL